TTRTPLPRLHAERLRQDRRRSVRPARHRRRPRLRAAEVERDHAEARPEEVQHPDDAGPRREGGRPVRGGLQESGEVAEAEVMRSRGYAAADDSVWIELHEGWRSY